jgi:ectoine hydroxylase-related dioxygenase (phytanoyl-CoA dioxygenase family)
MSQSSNRATGPGTLPDGASLFAGDSFTTEDNDRAAQAARDRVFGEIDRLEMHAAIGQLDAKGYTVIAPELAAPPGFADRLRDAVLEAAERASGVRPDRSTGLTHAEIMTRHGQVQHVEPLIHLNPLFQEALLNERALAVVTYLLGESCVLFSSTGQIKGPGFQYLPLHADQANSGTPAPFPPFAQVCNAVWALTDYSADDGATCFVAGSHKLCRHPTAKEAVDLSLFEPLEAKAGSIIVWHGNTWHGAVPRRNPGLRVGIIQYFGRWFHNPGSQFARLFTREEVARYPPRFAQLIGAQPTPGLDHRYGSRVARFSQFG